MPALMWVALFVHGGHADVVLPLRDLPSSSGESILSLSLPSVIQRFKMINKTHKERHKAPRLQRKQGMLTVCAPGTEWEPGR